MYRNLSLDSVSILICCSDSTAKHAHVPVACKILYLDAFRDMNPHRSIFPCLLLESHRKSEASPLLKRRRLCCWLAETDRAELPAGKALVLDSSAVANEKACRAPITAWCGNPLACPCGAVPCRVAPGVWTSPGSAAGIALPPGCAAALA